MCSANVSCNLRIRTLPRFSASAISTIRARRKKVPFPGLKSKELRICDEFDPIRIRL